VPLAPVTNWLKIRQAVRREPKHHTKTSGHTNRNRHPPQHSNPNFSETEKPQSTHCGLWETGTGSPTSTRVDRLSPGESLVFAV